MSQFFYKYKSFALQIKHKLNQLFREGELREKLFYLEEKIERTSKMEDLHQLKLKKNLLLLELEALTGKISLMEEFEKLTVTNVPESQQGLKTKAIPEQTAPGKESTNPLKGGIFPKNTEKEIVSSKDTANLVQTETSKDKSIPLIPVALEKSKLAELPKQISLRPSWQDILLNKGSTSKKGEHFYVIYNGEKPGIYTNWGIVQNIVSETTTSFKKFKTFDQAQASANEYQKIHGGEIKLQEKLLVPKMASERPILKKPLPKEQTEKVEIIDTSVSKQDFDSLWLKIRNAGSSDFTHENFFSTDKKNKSLYNFCEGADPFLVFWATQAGLTKTIYPSNNLLEIKHFPEMLKKAIKNFRTKIAKKTDDKIYLNISSTIPSWEEKTCFPAFHFIEIGLVNQKKDFPPIKEFKEDSNPSNELLYRIREGSIKTIVQKLVSINEESKIKVNFCNENYILTSWFPKIIDKNDLEKIIDVQRKFNNNAIMVGSTTRQSICRQMTKIFSNHKCTWCGDKEKEDAKSIFQCDSESSGTEQKEE